MTGDSGATREVTWCAQPLKTKLNASPAATPGRRADNLEGRLGFMAEMNQKVHPKNPPRGAVLPQSDRATPLRVGATANGDERPDVTAAFPGRPPLICCPGISRLSFAADGAILACPTCARFVPSAPACF